MKIKLTIEDRVLTATVTDSKTARDFVSLLPLTLTMSDLFGREKFGHLPREISEGGKRTHTYEIGDIAYWSPGPDVAIFYSHGGQSIPDPGVIVIGKIDSGVETLNIDGSVRVKIEVAGQSPDQKDKLAPTSIALPASVPTLEDLRTVAPAFAKYHLNRAMDNGLTKEQASEVLTQLAFYAGWPNVFSAIPVVKTVFEKRATSLQKKSLTRRTVACPTCGDLARNCRRLPMTPVISWRLSRFPPEELAEVAWIRVSHLQRDRYHT
jgi:hypothetical protein